MDIRSTSGAATSTSGWAKVGLGLVAVLALVYALPVYSFLLSMDSGLAWINLWYSTLVTKEFADAPSAYEGAQRGYLHAMSPYMKLHVAGMATALAFGWLQFVPALRRAYPRLHRMLGGVLLLSMLLGGLGSLAMVFGGKTYGSSDLGQQLTVVIGMVYLTALVWVSMGAAICWLVAGDTKRHGEWMVMTYALICTAIILRLGFLVYGWLGYSFEEGFQLSTQFAIQPVVLSAVWIIAKRRHVALRHTEATPATVPLWRAATRWLPAPWWPALTAAAAGVLILVAGADVMPFNDYRYHLGVRLNVAAVAVALLVAGACLRGAQQSGLKETSAQWGVRAAGLLTFPILSLLFWGLLLPTGKSSEVLSNTAPVFAAALALYVPDVLISAATWRARRRISDIRTRPQGHNASATSS